MVDTLVVRAVQRNDEVARDTLMKLHRGILTFADCLATMQATGLVGLGHLIESLSKQPSHEISEAAFEQYLTETQLGENTRNTYRYNFKTLSFFVRKGETLEDLPSVLERYRVNCVKLERNYRAFDFARELCQGWVRKRLGPNTETYKQVKGIDSLKRPKTHKSNPYFSPTDIKNIMAYLPDGIAAMMWFQVLHGMNAKELLVDGYDVVAPDGTADPNGIGLQIWGRKNDFRYGRITPLLTQPPELATTVYSRYHNWLKRASLAAGFQKFGTHDLRRSFVRWCVRAGIPKPVADQYGGWMPSQQIDEYLYSEVQSELSLNRDKLKKWIDEELAKNPPKTDVVKVRAGVRIEGLYGERTTMVNAVKNVSKERKAKLSRSPMAPKPEPEEVEPTVDSEFEKMKKAAEPFK
ncbi:MAG: hypothetical protein ACK5ZO_00135 [Gemmatimonas sp.]|uniref:hypothetical protein n=1 Tax=Gemmatimonas sp. TaxID=1962908 RepID=UPI00391F26D4